MNWHESLAKIAGVARMAQPIARMFIRVPMLDSLLTAIVAAEGMGGTGPEKMAAALKLLEVSKPYIVDMLEGHLNIEIPDAVADKYVRGQVQLIVDLMNELKMLPRKKEKNG